MNKQILIIHSTEPVEMEYTRLIAQKAKSFNTNCNTVHWSELNTFLEKHPELEPANTLLHYRSTGPKIVTPKARELEKKGFRLINSAEVLARTGDKFYSYEWARKCGIKLPITFKGSVDEIKYLITDLAFEEFILKPINSKGQGEYCFRSSRNDHELDQKLHKIPGTEIILQEFVDYLSIYRVIVIGGKVLDGAVFRDKPTAERWKVSVCLNPEMHWENDPDPELLLYAKHLAKVFEAEIAFVDVFQTRADYVLSEINTACNLTIHEQKSGYDIAKAIAVYLVAELAKI